VHAASCRAARFLIGQRAAAALVASLLLVGAGCSAGSSDNPGLDQPSTASGSTASVPPGSAGPRVSVAQVNGVGVPQLTGHPTANTTLQQTAAGLTPGCQPITEDDTPKLASFVWKCGTKALAAVTVGFDPDRKLALGDLLTGDYQSYLSSVAATQFRAEGVSNAATSDLSTWFVGPEALDVVFPNGIVSYPLASLGLYIDKSGPL
jgi:hypothetical protein